MTSVTADRSDSNDGVAFAACRLYEAECQLHVAHQSQVDEWIAAASEKLHAAIEAHAAAVRRAASRHFRVAS